MLQVRMRILIKMELRRGVGISSSWDVSGDFSSVLYVANSSGSLLDEPLSGEQASIILTAPESDSSQSPCLLVIDLTQLRGYVPLRIEFTSSSRTSELYCGHDCEDYIGTERGTLTGTSSSPSNDSSSSVKKLYSCSHGLPSDSLCQNISIKLLSLRGMSQVLVERINLVVSEDHGGSATTTVLLNRGMAGNGVDIQLMLSSLPVDGGSIPPFMQTLVSSLTRLSTTQMGSAQKGVEDKEEQRPAELSNLMETLRQMRPPPLPETTLTQSQSQSSESYREGEEHREENGIDESDRGQSEDSHRSRREDELETRLKKYIDEKFEELEKTLESRLEQLLISKLKSVHLHEPQICTES